LPFDRLACRSTLEELSVTIASICRLGRTLFLSLTVLIIAGVAAAEGLTCVLLDHGVPAKPVARARLHAGRKRLRVDRGTSDASGGW
jgi:hypothetical protein